MASLNQALAGSRIVAFDTETTGLSPVRDRVIEIAALSMVDGVETGRFESLVDPEIPIPPELVQIHGIDDGMVRGKPRFQEVAARFMEFVGDGILAAHNAPYDLAMMIGPALRAGLRPAGNPVIDTCRLSRRLVEAPNHQLGTVARVLGIEISRAHRAMPDVEATASVLQECLRRMGDKITLADVEQISAARLTFSDGGSDKNLLPHHLQAIGNAFRSGGRVEIVYRGGSHGDRPRAITPLFLLELDGRLNVSALCHIDDIIKNFRIGQLLSARPA
jgi:DNA polymerase III epsilon subunit family exonuclease